MAIVDPRCLTSVRTHLCAGISDVSRASNHCTDGISGTDDFGHKPVELLGAT
jgi:hypothetical protein